MYGDGQGRFGTAERSEIYDWDSCTRSFWLGTREYERAERPTLELSCGLGVCHRSSKSQKKDPPSQIRGRGTQIHLQGLMFSREYESRTRSHALGICLAAGEAE